MSKVIQQQRSMAIGLFSNALFCLWLSSACLVVWMDFGAGTGKPAAQAISVASKPAATATVPDGRVATPTSDGGADAA